MQYNYFHYPADKLPSYGSVAYFAYRKFSDSKKEILYLLDQVKSQIISCTELYNNIEVANQKMNWWIKEINNLKDYKNMSSPQLKKLAETFDKNILYKNLITDIHYSIENSSNTERNFPMHVYKNFLGIETLKALFLNDFRDINYDNIKQINANNEVIRHIFCIPKHFYNHIIFDKKITSNISKSEFEEIASKWLKNYKPTKLDKRYKPLEKINKIHYKMLKKYLKKVDNPFNEAIAFSPLTLLFYSI
ncbi:hypothetical protein SD28_00265 [Allofrancisella guangzhouensis]|uniref:Uncharacterized protein n=2 Tax=Allofrancisella guangzhouensis TaxID=594679 RepID=A0A0A8E1W7_9GAMM|nr:hypothetical protein [Allofrancisella guangzhouensis]AJC48205.1 hypothetical protein SD28_00265 [Allofrancisella guangzhouensis]MBK2027072.1 hypothetical protein [Allofrancisella guangzhouensis]MBK2046106.1 hypothetical protein [Allofrancisella guangzhouensis]